MQGRFCFAEVPKPSLCSQSLCIIITFINISDTRVFCTCSRVARVGEDPLESALTPSPAAICLPQLRPVPAQQTTAVTAPIGNIPQPAAALPPQLCQPHTFSLVQSTTSAGSNAVRHRAKGHGFPPIPGASTQTSWSPHKDQQAALSTGEEKAAGVRPGKQQGQTQVAGKVSRGRAKKGVPAWNSNFSIKYEEPLSIKDQERALRHAAQGRSKQLHASAASREQGPSVVNSKLTSANQPPSSWPALSNFTHQPAALRDSRPQQPASAARHHTKATTPSQNVDGAYMGSEAVEPTGWEQSKGRTCSIKLRGGSTAYSRNLDSAQSPLRPAKGFISDGRALLCKFNKFCFLPSQV